MDICFEECAQTITIALPGAQDYEWLPRDLQESYWICMPPYWGNVQWWRWDSITWRNGIYMILRRSQKMMVRNGMALIYKLMPATGGAKMPRIQMLCALATEVIRCYVMNISQRRMITSHSDMRKSAPNGLMSTLTRTKSQSGSMPMTATCQSIKWSKFNTKKMGCSTRMINGMPWKTLKGAWMLFPRVPNTCLE